MNSDSRGQKKPGFFDPGRHLKDIFRSLKYRNYRLFFTGQSVSLIGTWMQRAAVSWLVYRLTGSASILGLVAFSGRIPTFLFSPLGGIAADRYDRRKLIMATQIAAAIQALVLAVLVLSGNAGVWHLVILSVVLGVINAFDMPARQSFMMHMIDNPEDIGNAVALNSSMVNGARLIGPSAAGVIIAAAGEGPCFVVNAVSYILVITTLAMMRVKPRKPVTHESVITQLKGGMKYVWEFEPVRYLIALLAVSSIAGMPYIVLMPIFAKEILKGGPRTFGFLIGCSGIGALIGAIYLARKKTVLGLGKVIVFTSTLFGAALIAFAFSTVMWVSMLLLVAVGLGMMLQFSSTNTLLQTMVEDNLRGRVMSFYMAAFVGAVPIGNLIAGYAASKIGAPLTLMIGGICCIAGSLLFAQKLPALRKLIHPVYVQKGILSNDY